MAVKFYKCRHCGNGRLGLMANDDIDERLPDTIKEIVADNGQALAKIHFEKVTAKIEHFP